MNHPNTTKIKANCQNTTGLFLNKKVLDDLYNKYNFRQFVNPDPLQYIFDYDNIADREIAGIIASALAYGNVKQILRSVFSVLEKMGKSPRDYMESRNETQIYSDFTGFKHRFTTSDELSSFLVSVKSALKNYGSLNNLFLNGFNETDPDVHNALCFFVKELISPQDGKSGSLIALPWKLSACKRLHLYLRWMVRRDNVDPGGWTGIAPSKLIVPLDVHMFRVCALMNLTKRKQAGLISAREITSGFKKVSPNDPVKYDFALTRIGIRNDIKLEDFINQYHIIEVNL